MVTFVTTDPSGRWSGTGAPILPAQVDENFYEVQNAIRNVTLKDPVSIQLITAVGTTMTIDMSDGSRHVVDLPTATYTQRNAWQPGVAYAQNDTFWHGSDVFFVNVAHTSAAGFNPLEADSAGRFLYTRIISVPSVVPVGGLKGAVLAKKTATDNDVEWKNSVELPVANIISAAGAVTLNKLVGECQRLSVTGDVTSMTIANFGLAGQCSKIVLEVWNTGAFNFAFPAGTIWPGGVTPVVSSGAGKKDVFILLTMDGGTTIYGTVIGQDFK